MNDEQMIYMLIAFVLGWLVSRHMVDGFIEGFQQCGDADDLEMCGKYRPGEGCYMSGSDGWFSSCECVYPSSLEPCQYG